MYSNLVRRGRYGFKGESGCRYEPKSLFAYLAVGNGYVLRRRASVAKPMMSSIPDDGSGTFIRSSFAKVWALGRPFVIMPVTWIGLCGI